MINLSLSSLSVIGHYNTPFFVNNRVLNVFTSQFKKFSHTIFYQPFHLKLKNSRIDGVLNSAIYVAKSDYDDIVFTSTQSFLTDFGDVDIDGCSFLNCHSPQKGGGLFVIRDQEVWIEDTYFYRCTADDEGGAMYLYTDDERAYTYYVCVEECCARNFNHYALKKSTYRSYENYTTVFHCGGNGYNAISLVFQEGPGKICYTNDNYSYNHVAQTSASVSGMGAASDTSGSYFYHIRYSNIESNSDGKMFYIRTPSTSTYYSYGLNFANNTCSDITIPMFFCLKYSFSFDDMFIIGNVGRIFFDNSELGSIGMQIRYSFDDCYFDIPYTYYSYISNDDVEWSVVGRTVDVYYLLETRNCLSRYSGLSPTALALILVFGIMGGMFLIFGITMCCIIVCDDGSCSCSCSCSTSCSCSSSCCDDNYHPTYSANQYNESYGMTSIQPSPEELERNAMKQDYINNSGYIPPPPSVAQYDNVPSYNPTPDYGNYNAPDYNQNYSPPSDPGPIDNDPYNDPADDF